MAGPGKSLPLLALVTQASPTPPKGDHRVPLNSEVPSGSGTWGSPSAGPPSASQEMHGGYKHQA